LAEAILGKHKSAVESLEFHPSVGGPFEITVNGRLLFSKRGLGRFPEAGEAEALVDEAMLAGRPAP